MKSHLIQLYPIVEKLLENGHQVTTIFFSGGNIKHENYTEIVVKNVFEKKIAEFSKLFLDRGSEYAVINLIKFMKFSMEAWSEVLEDSALIYWDTPEIHTMIKTGRKFEVVMSSYQQHCLLAEIFNSSFITFSPAGPVPWLLSATGNDINLSVQPLLTSSFIEPMTFKQRLMNHLESAVRHLTSTYPAEKIYDLRASRMGFHDLSLQEILSKRFSVFLSNHHPVTHGAWPYMPNIIEVGGLTLKDPAALPSHFQTFLDSAGPVVLVSFGSTLQPSQMGQDKLDILYEVFRSLPEYSFIWKWDGQSQDVPANVLVSPWLPQQDLLAHPNIKTFITHGGLGGITEAIYHKVTLVGIPFGNDQISNLERASRHGYCQLMLWEKLSVEALREAIRESVESLTMQAAVERVHSVYTDREMKPVERAVWWMEYVCRHRGADILQPGLTEVAWYQYHHLDILLFVTLMVVVMATLLLFLCSLSYRTPLLPPLVFSSALNHIFLPSPSLPVTFFLQR